VNHESFERVSHVKGSSNRTFGFVFAGFFLVVATSPLLSGRPFRIWAIGLSSVFLLLGGLWPAVLGPLNRLWMKLGLVLHRVTNPVLLGGMFFLVVTPAGLLMRAFGIDLLRLEIDRRCTTYWIVRRPPGPAPDSLNHQF
jgi:hypothetical protein